MKCPSCVEEMEEGFLYLRGLGGSLFWSEHSDTGFFSRQNLEQIDLGQVSITGTAAQAVLKAARCRRCNLIAFTA
jgi:hypothetical protein